MSDLISDFGYNDNPRFNQSAPLNYSVEDIYNITRGAFNEFDMKGYNPPKTAVPISHEYKIPGDKDRDIFASITKRAKEPDPSTYAAGKDKVYKRYWDKATGKFKKGRRNTFTEETMKISAKIPGPGAYMPTPRAGEAKKVTRLGKFKYFLHSKIFLQ